MASAFDRLFPVRQPSLLQSLWWGVLLELGLVGTGFGLYAHYFDTPRSSYSWLPGAGISLYAIGQGVGPKRKRLFVLLLLVSLALLIAGVAVGWYKVHARFGAWW